MSSSKGRILHISYNGKDLLINFSHFLNLILVDVNKMNDGSWNYLQVNNAGISGVKLNADVEVTTYFPDVFSVFAAV